MEKKMKHLDFIQLIIIRMSADSFLLKGWAVTLVVALFALDISKNNINLIKVSFLPIVLFWMLDGYFLYQERLFRNLYEEVRIKDEEKIDFSMKRPSMKFLESLLRFLDATFSKTLAIFYGALTITNLYILASLIKSVGSRRHRQIPKCMI